jgi:mono/diheme cytochrome c family protein
MRLDFSRFTWLACAAALAVFVGPPAIVLSATPQHDAGAHTHAEAAKLKNPVAPNAASVAAGKKLYEAQCASCHGASGKGDGKNGALLKPVPSDFTDARWKHGSSDGEIFTLIRDGAKQTGMRAYGGRVAPQDIWHLVNYLRTLGPKPKPSH